MQIEQIKASGIPPIRDFEIEGLGTIVIIAGANGSGKTRLKEAIIQTFRNPKRPQVEIVLKSTRPKQEEELWQSETLLIEQGKPNPIFQTYMSSRTRGGTYTGTVIQVNSDRSVQPVQFQPITWAVSDPDDEELPYTYYLDIFSGRWPQLVNKIFFKVASRDHKIAQYVKTNPTGSSADALRSNPDPFLPYQDIFAKLLPGKQLEPIDPKQPQEFHYKVGDSGPFAFSTLSSGEQEVVKIAFDLIWKRIRHCVILVDEPELHLHPTLAFRLIETIKGIGENTNQYIFFTHSADLISTYYSTGNVYFIDTVSPAGNQAHRLSRIDDQHTQTTRVLGSNLGIFAVGKKLVFVEGRYASIDRLTYHKAAQALSVDANVIPTGSVENLLALRTMVEELNNSLFGLGFYMVRDRDGLDSDAIAALERSPRFRCLPRRHVENYPYSDIYI